MDHRTLYVDSIVHYVDTMKIRVRARRTIGTALAVGALTLSLTSCIAPGDWVTATADCTSWTVTPINEGVAMIMPGSETNGELDYHTYEVIDGTGAVLYSATTTTFETDGYPTVTPYMASPTANPITVNLYNSNRPGFSQAVGGCDSLPVRTTTTLSPGQAATAAAPPSFDVRFGGPIDESTFTVADLELGGDAHPTGATITRLTPTQKLDVPWPSDRIGAALMMASDIFRVVITGVENDGSVTLRVPDGLVTGSYDSTNLASGTATAIVDTTGPSLAASPDITRQLTPGNASAAISWNPPAANDPSGVADTTCAPAAGSSFTPGDTAVSCTATDTLGNASSTTFTVHVLAAQTPTVQLVQQDAAPPVEGGHTTFAVSATDYTGTEAPLAADDYTVSSSSPTDEITTSDGSFVVHFPHASPHTITVTQTSTGATAELTLQVTPRPVVQPARNGPDRLSSTGADSAVPATAAILLLLTGAALTLLVRARHAGGKPAR